MTSTRQDLPVAGCTAERDQLPGCSSGPAGRVGFVARELADLWRELRDHRPRTTDQQTKDRP